MSCNKLRYWDSYLYHRSYNTVSLGTVLVTSAKGVTISSGTGIVTSTIEVTISSGTGMVTSTLGVIISSGTGIVSYLYHRSYNKLRDWDSWLPLS